MNTSTGTLTGREKEAEFGIVFLHHDTDPVTMHHLNMIRTHNPEAAVVTVSQWGKVLPGGYDARKLATTVPWIAAKFADIPASGVALNGDQRWQIWSNADLAVYLWFHHRKERAKRWIILEWDVFCNTAVQRFYSEVWNADSAAGHVLHTNDHGRRWYWFQHGEIQKLPEKFAKYALGLAPLAGTFMSNSAMTKIADAAVSFPELYPVFCELRLGTLCEYLGIQTRQISLQGRKTLSGDAVFSTADLGTPAIWHKVKSLEGGNERF